MRKDNNYYEILHYPKIIIFLYPMFMAPIVRYNSITLKLSSTLGDLCSKILKFFSLSEDSCSKILKFFSTSGDLCSKILKLSLPSEDLCSKFLKLSSPRIPIYLNYK